MRRTTLALITASLLSVAACGGDDSTPGTAGGGSGTGGTTGSGGGKGGGAGTGGSSGASGGSGTGGTSGSGGSGGTGGAGGAGQAGKAGGDASTGTDVRPDTPTGTPDATTDATTDGSAPGDAADGTATDTSSPPDGGTSDTTPPTDGSAGDVRSDAPTDGTSTMVLTSSAFTAGMTIPAAYTCETTPHVSPPLAWTAGPSGTLSYAIVFTDKNNGLVHSGIYDIPPGVMSLPMNVEKAAMPANVPGAKQVLGYNNMPGYAGPCPGATEHTYEFMLYAVDVAALPGIATTQKGAALVTALQAHDIVTTTLTGKAKTP